ncbi:MAG: DUF4382 domain-containing protein [Hormoscilla sp. SP5CHS1]|nr:DUF4382 domain-containing protein [Hormoscilla sp. SP5CHS1]
MRQKLLLLGSLGFLAIRTGTLWGCASMSPETSTSKVAPSGRLQIRANGEDFVRQGFLSKDGWNISFDHLYVTLADVAVTQSNPDVDTSVVLDTVKTVDLAAGDENADPILVHEFTDAPAGRYNTLSWKMVKATSGPAKGYVLVMEGTAIKSSQVIEFAIAIDREYAYSCGEFVGEQRKGILSPGGTAEVEATFHIDHIFGDGEVPPDEEINIGALGFAPLAALANNGKLEVDMATLKQSLSPQDYQILKKTLVSLGHVGEGHCQESLTLD